MEIDGNSQECVYDIPSCDEDIQALELTASGEVRPRASRPTESTLSAEASDDAVPPLMPILVKPVVRQGTGAPDAQAGVQVVKMSLLKDLRLRIDKRTLREEDLAALVPEMADVDGGGCRPQCRRSVVQTPRRPCACLCSDWVVCYWQKRHKQKQQALSWVCCVMKTSQVLNPTAGYRSAAPGSRAGGAVGHAAGAPGST